MPAGAPVEATATSAREHARGNATGTRTRTPNLKRLGPRLRELLPRLGPQGRRRRRHGASCQVRGVREPLPLSLLRSESRGGASGSEQGGRFWEHKRRYWHLKRLGGTRLWICERGDDGARRCPRGWQGERSCAGATPSSGLGRGRCRRHRRRSCGKRRHKAGSRTGSARHRTGSWGRSSGAAAAARPANTRGRAGASERRRSMRRGGGRGGRARCLEGRAPAATAPTPRQRSPGRY